MNMKTHPRERSCIMQSLPWHRATVFAAAVAMFAAAPLVLAQKPTAPQAAPPAAATVGTIGHLRDTGRIRLGYRSDARPFSYTDESGQPAGYSVALCRRVAEAAKADAGAAGLKLEWVPVTLENRFRALQQGQVDLVCGAETVTLARRAEVSFSIPIFPGGIGALVRADAPARLREVLAGHGQAYRPTWRASATQVLQARAFSAVAGTTGEKWLGERIRDLQVITDLSRVPSYDAGIQAVLDRRSDAFFAERAVLLDAAKRHAGARDLIVIDRFFTYEPLALACAPGDEELRLLVDRALSRLYASGEFGDLYTTWFGEPDANTLAFFRWNTLPE
jgi:ABC-type amino acid transport substrate-binding protein